MVLLAQPGIALRESLCEGDNAFWLQGPCLGAVGAGGTLGTLISELLGLAAVPKWPNCGSSACEMSDVPWCWGSSDSELHLLGGAWLGSAVAGSPAASQSCCLLWVMLSK